MTLPLIATRAMLDALGSFDAETDRYWQEKWENLRETLPVSGDADRAWEEWVAPDPTNFRSRQRSGFFAGFAAASSEKREAGRAVTEKDVERAAAAFWAKQSWSMRSWGSLLEGERTMAINAMRAALSTLPASPAPAEGAGPWLDGWERLTREQQADVSAHIRGLTSDAPTYERPPHGWTCFHCGETFKTPGMARLHFGALPSSHPTCIAEVVRLRAALERIASVQLSPVGAGDGDTYLVTGTEIIEAKRIARAALNSEETKP